ncbi:MCE family protein [Amycolatopsis sp. CA-230715]|uniref:MCE family protein n=1 Tax=Amycolatopsis sp. CA-230715 TaxID=2745196 RepID=UPI001C037253|nr:MCE family protein [Amycolatopsis sp. CA-230715]QWF83864.1 Lipoprotein LprN [Amycolatopsis sp. CA-230715]
MRTLALAGVAVLAAATLTGCGLSLQGMDAGQEVDGPSYELTAVFTDVSGLPSGGEVKLGPSSVGRVVATRSEHFQAKVTLRLRQDVRLPKGTRAELKLSTALGDQYIDLRPPASGGTDCLADGATIPVADTVRGPDIENTLAVLGMVLNNSGLDQARTIITELNTALGGREGKIRDLLARANGILSTLDARSGDFTRALGSLNRLAKIASDNRAVLDQAFTQINPAVDVLRSQQDSLNKLLANVTPLAKTTDETLGRTKETVGSIVDGIGPVLDELNGFSGSLGSALGTLKSANALLGRAIPGDYLNLNARFDVPGALTALFTGVSGTGTTFPGGIEQLLKGGTR